jgi:hypothetical protein
MVAALAASAPPSPFTPYFWIAEVDDRIDPLSGDPELESQLDIPMPDEVDERGDRRVLGCRGDALPDAIAVDDGNRAALAQPCVMALAGQCDDARSGADRELDREDANAAARPSDHDRLTHGRGNGAHGGHPRHSCDEQRARHLPRDRAGFAVRLAASTRTYSAWLARLW